LFRELVCITFIHDRCDFPLELGVNFWNLSKVGGQDHDAAGGPIAALAIAQNILISAFIRSEVFIPKQMLDEGMDHINLGSESTFRAGAIISWLRPTRLKFIVFGD
jgi:hypothetical protein